MTAKKQDLSYRGRRAGTAIRILDICAGTLGELLEQKGTLYPQLFNLALNTGETEAGGIVGVFDFIGAVLELDTLSSIGLFDGGREGRRDG
jgi:hypothetical protein